MTSENIAVTGPVKVVSDSPSRVAYELMNEIAHNEGKKSTEKTREYLLTLYRQCHKAVNGHQLESILDQKN